MYSGQQLEQSLNLAASHQEFRGKGASEDDTTYSMIEKLDGLTRNSKPEISYFQPIIKVFVPILLPSNKHEPTNFLNGSMEESQLDVKLEPFDSEEQYFDTRTAPTKRKSGLPNQMNSFTEPRSSCTICKESKKSESLWYFGRTVERLILVLGCLSRGFFTVMCAEEIMRKKKRFHVCSCHIRETVEEIYEKLGLTIPEDLYSCSMELFENIFNSVAHLNPGMTKEEFQEALFEFFIKYEHVREENEARPQLSWNKVAKVKEEADFERVQDDCNDEDEVDPLSPELINSITTYDLSTPRNRRCTICRLLSAPDGIKSFIRECDRLLIIIGCLVGESINIRQAEGLMKKTSIYVCNSHIQETHREIYKKMYSAEPEDLEFDSKIQKMMTSVTLLIPDMKLSPLRRMLNEFLIKYNYLMSEEQKYVPKPLRTRKSASQDLEEMEETEENVSLDGGEHLEDSAYYPDDSDDSTWPDKKHSPKASTSSAKKSRKMEDSDEDWEPSVVKKKKKVCSADKND